MQEEGTFVSETGNWNVAADYARLKIMKPLHEADEYALIAEFGAADFIEELNLQINPDILKIKGFKRLVNCLIMLIDNSLFAVKKDNGKPQLVKYKKELKKINKSIPLFTEVKTNQVKKTSRLKLIIGTYEKILERVLEIKALINKPLNQNHLIFTDKKEFDPRTYKVGVRERMIKHG